jgi:hypothetical protein
MLTLLFVRFESVAHNFMLTENHGFKNNTIPLPSDRKSDQINYLDADSSPRHPIVSYTMA